MKLSDIKGDAAILVIADILQPISNIATDEKVKKLFDKKDMDKDNVARSVMTQLTLRMPEILKTHKDDIIDILSAVAMIPREEYVKNMTLMSLLKDSYELITDKATLDLFTSAQIQGQE